MIPAERAHLRASATTHPGMSGKNNEDRYAVAAFRTEGERPLPVIFAIISDGIGGHKAGEIAAEMVVETVSQAVARSNANTPIQTLREAIMRSSQEILVQAESDAERKGMGATCACALIVGDRLYIAYVGDSRIYLMRNGMIQQISVDHTWVQEAIEAGILDPELGKDHPNAHVIRRYLGSKQPVDPDTRLRLSPHEEGARSEANQGLHLRPNDHVILSSDGLTDLVSDEEIKATLDQLDQDEALSKLVDMANQRGGHDNITIVDLLVPENLPEATQPISLPPAPVRKKRARWVIPAALLLLVVLLLAVVAGAIFYMTATISQVTATPTTRIVTTQPVVIPSLEATTLENTPSKPVGSTPATIAVSTSEPGLVTPFVTLTPWPTNIPAQ